MRWRIGCSGFSYKEWKGNFYPEKLAQSRWFEYYTEKFNTLELNTTFYRFPQLKTLEKWFGESPGDFLFAVKAPRLITHYKRFNDCEKLLSDFYGTARAGLQQKLGPILFQLPRQIVFDKIFLQKIMESLDRSFDNVIEFRHASWWKKGVYSALAKNNISFCGIDHPDLPTDTVANTATAYYRFHGSPKLYYSQYDESTLNTVADSLLRSKKIKTAFIYFNNTATMAAISNANQLTAYIKSKE